MSVYCVWIDIAGCTYVNYVEHGMWVLRCCVLRVCVCVREHRMYVWMSFLQIYAYCSWIEYGCDAIIYMHMSYW
jgi:hypothetical protein